ncbi:MAG: hypothetical protein HYZ54_14620 [Ignavibacteriae bacterium]|nr:hypothetical protein [Ignavibacteriota bacterium]
MGRNDTGSMDSLSSMGFCTKAVKTIILAVLCIIGTIGTSAQQPGKPPASTSPDAPIKKYSIYIDWKDRVAHVYSVNHKTKVKRVFRDNLELNYERNVTYFVSMSSIGIEKGFIKLQCNIDSLRYSFTEGNSTLYYDSQDEKKTTLKTEFPDFTSTFGMMNHQFMFLISPYGDVAKVTGIEQSGDLDWLRQFVDESGTAMDTLQKLLWYSVMSDENLKMIADISKGLIAGKMQIKTDSVWTRNIGLRLDGLNFTDSAKVQVASHTKDNIVISGASTNLQPVLPQDARMFKIPGLGSVVSGNGSGTLRLDLTPRGTIKKQEVNYIADIEGKYKLENFKENIQTTVSCTLLGQYKW